jgi:hypothetical protein
LATSFGAVLDGVGEADFDAEGLADPDAPVELAAEVTDGGLDRLDPHALTATSTTTAPAEQARILAGCTLLTVTAPMPTVAHRHGSQPN